MKIRKITRNLIWIAFLFGCHVCSVGQPTLLEADSSFWSLSLPELQSYRAFYVQELEMLQEEKRNLIRRGIVDGERLLEIQPNNEVIDEILIRLADLYYYQEKDQYLEKMQAYDEKLMQLERGEIQEVPEAPRADYQKSMAIYQRIIDEFPRSDLVDDAVYNQGFIYEEIGEHKRANQIYRHLIKAYPESRYVPESFMRLGEYYFNPPLNEIDRAISYYKKVIQYKDSPRYDEALYKLGWSYYRLSQYPEAISYFTMLVDEMQIEEDSESTIASDRADLRDEALTYIAISFIDFGGPEKANTYVKEIGNPQWGLEMLEKLGDIYMREKEEYLLAIQTYEALLDRTYSSADGPNHQKKIVDCYRALNDEKKTFETRQKLYEMYKPDGTWWHATTNDKAKLASRQLTEQALRENVSYLIRQAEANNRKALFEEAAEMGQIYLSTYPEDIYAYMIRWNVALILDTRLKRYKEAFEEYLTISMVYNTDRYALFAREKGLADIRDAAENAIIVADSLVQLEKRSQSEMERLSKIQDETSKDIKEFIPFSPANALLAVAYDNYIKLFPFDEKTAMILANAGALYYTHNQFDEALKYFKTLVDYFPKSQEVQNVQYSILESYFGKEDYQSSEILAKKILSGNNSDEIKSKAEARLGEAIFLKAETYSKTNQSKMAADEYYRMALEVPTAAFADRALFNAGTEYDRLHDYESAIRAYENLRVSYSGSSLLLDALNNLAFDYGETGHYQKAAERYESFATVLNHGEKAKDALYNAYVFYGKAENWPKAIETGEKYAIRFPNAKDAANVYFQTATYREKIGETEAAIRVYFDFSNRFPDSPYGVEAFYQLGTIYQNQGDLKRAENVYQKGYQKSQDLKKRKMDENGFYAAECLFHADRLIQKRYNEIHFEQPQQHVDKNLKLKQQLLQQLVDQYTTVAGYRTFRLPESVFQIGALYDNFAKTWAAQEMPSLDATSRAVKEKEINERTTLIYTQALTAYMKAVEGLKKMVRQFASESVQAADTLSGASDTLATLIQFWLDSSQVKISETLYQLAEVNTKTIDRLLAAPLPRELDDMAKLEYQSQVLAKAIRPIANLVMNAHIRNLHVADSLLLHNQWTEASKDQILSISGSLGNAYGRLAFQALDHYRMKTDRYRNRVFKKKDAVSEELTNEMVQFIELAKSYSAAAVISHREGVLRGVRGGVPGFETTIPQEDMIHFAFQMADTLEALIQLSIRDQSRADQLFLEKNDLYYEEALATFEDHVFFLDENLKLLLQETYKAEKMFPVPSPSNDWLKIRLVQLEPKTYSKKLNIPVETVTVRVDTTWWYASSYQDGWNSLKFQMRGWNHPKKDLGSSQKIVGTRIVSGKTVPRGKASFYLRKIFNVPGLPISGQVAFKANSSYTLYINQNEISKSLENTSRVVTSCFNQGINLLGLLFPEKNNFALEGFIKIQYISEQAIPEKETPGA